MVNNRPSMDGGSQAPRHPLHVLRVLEASRDRLAFVDNTAVTHVLIGENSATVADYNVAPHLE